MSQNKTSPICLFVYNRVDHLDKTLTALKNNYLAKESDLFIFSDGYDDNGDKNKIKVLEVRTYLEKNIINGFKSVTIKKQKSRLGLADSIVSGVTDIINKFGKVIVLEDDLITSNNFLSYMNHNLDLYNNERQVMHINGYIFPGGENLSETFFGQYVSSWGWATWQRAWSKLETDPRKLLFELKRRNQLKKFNFDNEFLFSSTLKANIRKEIKTWAVKWYASVFLNNGLSLTPNKTMLINIGHDGSGQNCLKSRLFSDALPKDHYHPSPKKEIEESARGRIFIKNSLKKIKPSLLDKIFSKIAMFKKAKL